MTEILIFFFFSISINLAFDGFSLTAPCNETVVIQQLVMSVAFFLAAMISGEGSRRIPRLRFLFLFYFFVKVKIS